MEQQTIEPPADVDLLAQAYFARGGTLRELLGMGRGRLELLYAYACRRYAEQDWEGARQIYMALVVMDAECFEYWLALGMCLQRMQRHEQAIACFAHTAVKRLDDPRSSYLAALSFLVLGNVAQATDALAAAVKWCGNRRQYAELRTVAARLLASIGENEEGETK